MVECKSEGVYKNLRYGILKEGSNTYLIDIDHPYLVYLFPFIFWIIPHKVYRINSNNYLDKLKIPEKNIKEKKNISSIFAGGISVFLGNLIGYFMDFFNIQSLKIANICILILIIIFAIIFRYYIGWLSIANLRRRVDINALETVKIRIRTKLFLTMIITFFFNMFFLICTFASGFAFVEAGNLIILFMFMVFLFIIFMSNIYNITIGDFKIHYIKER